MKFLPLIWSGVWRKPARTMLIFLQVSVAFALFGVLQGLKTGVEYLVARARADLLLVHASAGLADSLPFGLLERIKSVPGVRIVVPVALSAGNYQESTHPVGIVAIPPGNGWVEAFTYTIAPESLAAFKATRTGALARQEAAKKFGWKVGDRIPLLTTQMQTNGSTTWVFDLVGTYTDTDIGGGSDVILINYDYFDEARLAGKGTVNHFNVAVADPRRAVAIGDEIDRRFANSANETRTDSLRDLAQSEFQAIGDLNFLIRTIVGVVLATLLFATATMMMQTIRERTPELALLKTLGFSNATVSLFIVSEATLICIAAAASGLCLALLVFPFASRIVPGLSMPLPVIAAGLTYAALFAAVSASVPALRAARLSIVNAMASR